MKIKKNLKLLRRLLSLLMCLCILGIGALSSMNAFVKLRAGQRILTPENAVLLEDVDCILVLGCLVRSGGVPSDMLHDRLTRGVALYQAGAAPKLLMSGDHGREDYDEVDAMKRFAVDAGIPSADVFMDHAGFSTYESIYRAKEIFHAKKILIVTQEYHLYRALFIAQSLGLDAYGVGSDYHSYVGQPVREFREVLARVKDCFSCVFKPEPTYLGDAIPIWGSGDLTHDDASDFS